MKIAITSTGPNLDATVDPRFGRAQFFVIVEPETLEFEALENPNLTLGGGAGIQSAQLMSEKSVTAVLTGNCGPNAFQIFNTVGIQVIVGVAGTVKQAVANYKNGVFEATAQANVAAHSGLGFNADNTMPMQDQGDNFVPSRMGRGMGGGGGRGMRRNKAFQPNSNSANQQTVPIAKKDDEIQVLKEQAAQVQSQLEAIQKRIKELEK
jgi:predicted Fe-Mo cluster-binding NifX family protein